MSYFVVLLKQVMPKVDILLSHLCSRNVFIFQSVTCIWVMLNCFLIVRGEIQWKVERKVTGYGEDLVLFCEVENCCSDQAGWSVDDNPIHLDVRLMHRIEGAKYDANVNSTGFSLIIRRLTKDDLNKTYICTYGFEDSKPRFLGESDAFLCPVEEGGKEDSNKPLIIGVCLGVIITLIVTITIVVCCIMNQRRQPKQKQQDMNIYVDELTPIPKTLDLTDQHNDARDQENIPYIDGSSTRSSVLPGHEEEEQSLNSYVFSYNEKQRHQTHSRHGSGNTSTTGSHVLELANLMV